MQTSPKQISLFTEETLTSSQEASLVSHTAQQENDLERQMTATSGRKCLEQLEKFSRVGWWAKMYAALLIGTGEWYSTKCRLTWKLKATKCSRFYFQLVPSTLPTEGIGFGLLPTTRARDGVKGADRKLTMKDGKLVNMDKNGTVYGMTLEQAIIQAGLLPTPTTQAELTETGRRKTKDGKNSHSLNLGRIVGMLPTPTLQDARIGINNIGGSQHRMEGGSIALADIALGLTKQILPTPTAKGQEGYKTRAMRKGHKASMSYLESNIQYQTGSTSQLNPRFVAEMMGFPVDYTMNPFTIQQKWIEII